MRLSTFFSCLTSICSVITMIFGSITIIYLLSQAYIKSTGLGLTLNTILFILLTIFFNWAKEVEEAEELKRNQLHGKLV